MNNDKTNIFTQTALNNVDIENLLFKAETFSGTPKNPWKIDIYNIKNFEQFLYWGYKYHEAFNADIITVANIDNNKNIDKTISDINKRYVLLFISSLLFSTLFWYIMPFLLWFLIILPLTLLCTYIFIDFISNIVFYKKYMEVRMQYEDDIEKLKESL